MKVERVAVYRFNEDWSGEFVSHFGIADSVWVPTIPFGQNLVWEDTYKQNLKIK